MNATTYLEAIASDPDRTAQLDDLDAYRYVTGIPSDGWTRGLPEQPVEFTAEEQNWLEGRHEPMSRIPDRWEDDAETAEWVSGESYDPPEWLSRAFPETAWHLWLALDQPRMTAETLKPAWTEDELPFMSLGDGEELFVPVIEGFAFRSLKTLVVGQSKAGKSFSTLAMSAEAIRDGLMKVLWLTEEPTPTVHDKVALFGLVDAVERGDLLIVRKTSVLETWQVVVRRVATSVHHRKIDMVIVDTARPWFGLEGDQSNDADVIGRAMDAFGPVCDMGAALIVLHQAPWDKLRARGSTEFHATSDLIFAVQGQGDHPRMVRYVGGRIADGIPDQRTVRWAGDHVEDLGAAGRDDVAGNLDKILDALEAEEDSMTVMELADETGLSTKTIGRHLPKLLKQGLVGKEQGKPLQNGGREPDRWHPIVGYFAGLFSAAEAEAEAS